MVKRNETLSSLLRHRILLQQPVNTVGVGGEVVQDWEDVAEVWAAIEPLQGSEQPFAEQLEAQNRSRITIRYRAGVGTEMRVVFQERAHGIRSVICPDEARERLVLIVEEQS